LHSNRGGDHACDNPIRIRREHLEQRFLREVMQTVLSDATMRWAEKEIGRRLTAPTADTSKARKELVKVERELHNVADAIARIGVGSLSVRATAGEVRTARNALQGILGIVRVDRRGKGYADLSTGVPTRMVAGACYAMSLRCRTEYGTNRSPLS
jgi:hypothetical protein